MTDVSARLDLQPSITHSPFRWYKYMHEIASDSIFLCYLCSSVPWAQSRPPYLATSSISSGNSSQRSYRPVRIRRPVRRLILGAPSLLA